MTARSRGAGDPERAWALAARFAAGRRRTLALAAPLSPEDALVQSMPDASPAKWHLAHTTWFFEAFVLAPGGADVPSVSRMRTHTSSTRTTTRSGRGSRARSAGCSHGRRSRRCSATARTSTSAWRPPSPASRRARSWTSCELGIAHEQQHQELLLTDMKHAFFSNPLRPAYARRRAARAPAGRAGAAARVRACARAASSRSARRPRASPSTTSGRATASSSSPTRSRRAP